MREVKRVRPHRHRTAEDNRRPTDQLHRPIVSPIVVLDEATAFADPENEVLIQKAFATLTKDRTVIMIAHRLSTVVGADKIIVLEEGHIVEQGTHAELTASGGLYARMWTDYNKAVQWKITSEKEAE